MLFKSTPNLLYKSRICLKGLQGWTRKSDIRIKFWDDLADQIRWNLIRMDLADQRDRAMTQAKRWASKVWSKSHNKRSNHHFRKKPVNRLRSRLVEAIYQAFHTQSHPRVERSRQTTRATPSSSNRWISMRRCLGAHSEGLLQYPYKKVYYGKLSTRTRSRVRMEQVTTIGSTSISYESRHTD